MCSPQFDLQHGDPVAGGDAEAGEGVGKPIHPRLQLLEGGAPLLEDYRQPVGHDGG